MYILCTLWQHDVTKPHQLSSVNHLVRVSMCEKKGNGGKDMGRGISDSYWQ